MLGIGDRHAQNILLDYKTAQVIHIDFGITFEQVRACLIHMHSKHSSIWIWTCDMSYSLTVQASYHQYMPFMHGDV